MFQEQEYGLVVSVQMSVHVEVPVGARWIFTLRTPEPPSVPVAFSVTVWRSGEPGSVRLAVGAVLSTRRFVTVEDVVVFPALSVVIARKS